MDRLHLYAVILAIAVFLSVLALRRFPKRVRIIFDVTGFVAISVYLGRLGASPLLEAPPGELTNTIFALRVIAAAWWLLGARLLVVTLWFTFHRDKPSRAARLSFELTGAAIYIVAILVVLKSVLALPIAGVLATSGVLAIVLGLALQNTLGDVFAGVAVGIEGPFKVGDRVALADKLEGQVVQVNWRSIWIQTDDNDVAIIPNSVVAKNQIINRSFPSQRRSVSIELVCPKGAMPDKVIDATISATRLIPAIMTSPAPSAIVTRLGRKSYEYSVSFWVDGTQGLGAIKGMLLRQCHRQLHYGGLLASGSTPEACAWQLLRDVVLFESLDDTRISALVTQLDPIDLEPGETLFSEHAADATLYVIAAGALQVAKGAFEATEVLGCVGAGDYLGEISLLTGAAHGASATALTHCRVYRLSKTALAPLIVENVHLAAAFDRSVQRGLRVLSRGVAVRAGQDVDGAPGQLLLRIRRFFRLGNAS